MTSIKNESKEFTVLYIELGNKILKDKELLSKYIQRIKDHNISVSEDLYPDSGFDLLLPKFDNDYYQFEPNQTKLVNFAVKCSCFRFINTNSKKIPVYTVIQEEFKRKLNKNIKARPYKIHPRSSIWKTDFRLANCTGIIDSGYRGNLFGSMHNIKVDEKNKLEYGNRYLQICMSDLSPFYIDIVPKIECDSKRGNGGLGSTGK